MTKKEFIDFLIHGLTGGKLVSSQFRKYHPNVVSMAVEHALNQIFYDLFKEDPSQLDLFAKSYDGVSLEYNATYRHLAAMMPDSVVQIKGDNGIRWVISSDNPSEEFVRLSRDSARNLHYLLANRVDDRYSYFLMDGKVVISGFNWEKQMISGSDAIVAGKYYMVDGHGPVGYNSKQYLNGDLILGVASILDENNEVVTDNSTWDETAFTGFLWEVKVPTDLSMGIIVPFSNLGDNDEFMIPSGKNVAVLQFVATYFKEMGFQDLNNDSQSQK